MAMRIPFLLALALASANLAAQVVPRLDLDPCSIGKDPQPNVTRYRPAGRVWPGGKIVFEGQNLDPSRFSAAIGSAPQAIVLTIGAATPTRIEATVPVRAEGGPYTPAAGDRLTVAYKGTTGCRVLNPNYIVADAFTVRTQAAGQNSAYFTIRHQMNLDGNIEGARTIKLLNRSDHVLSDRGLSITDLCDWNELPRSSRTITLTQNDFHSLIFGFMFDHRTAGANRSQSVSCKLPMDVVIQDPATNTSETVPFLIPMTVRNPRVITVDTRKVLTRFEGIQPTLDNTRTVIGDCGKLYEGDPRGDPNSKIGVTVQSGDWVFAIKSGITPTMCRYNSVPVEAQLGVAFGAIHWETTKAGNPNRCTADTPSPVNPHLLSTFQVYMSCDPGPLGDNGVTVRAAGIDLMVPFEMTPPVFSQEVPN